MGIGVEKNKEKTVHHVVDLTAPTSIQGVIQVEGKTPDSGTVYLYPRDMLKYKLFKSCESELDTQGRYSCLCLPPGRYDLELYAVTDKGEILEKRIVVDIEAGKAKILNFNF